MQQPTNPAATQEPLGGVVGLVVGLDVGVRVGVIVEFSSTPPIQDDRVKRAPSIVFCRFFLFS